MSAAVRTAMPRISANDALRAIREYICGLRGAG
jgi:hypothetical protein